MSLYTYDNTTIVGKAGKAAEMRFMPDGTAVTVFSVAVDRSFKKDGTMVKRTIWYRVSVFGNFAETCSKIGKGERVLVVGELSADWNTGGPKIYTKQDGTSGASFEITASTVRFLSDRNEIPQTVQAQEALEDDIPY